MGQLFDGIDASLTAFIEAQRMFFVSTAPLDAAGHLNVSPKGLDTLRVLSPTELAYLDYVGSGAETIAHLRENGRIVVMLCAFEGPPRIVRLHGHGRVVEPADAEYQHLRPLFPPAPSGRAIIVIAVERVADSCGFGVPTYRFERDRPQLRDWCDRKGEAGLREYQQRKNAASIDGLPALRWVTASGDAATKE